MNMMGNKEYKDPRNTEDKLLRDLKRFCQELHYKILELKSINPRIKLKSINFGEEKPEMDAILLKVLAIGELDITDKKLGCIILICKRDLA